MIHISNWFWVRIFRIRYWQRFQRFRQWQKIFLDSGWDKIAARQQAWRQSAWYDPRTGRSISLIESLERHRKAHDEISKT